MRSRPGLLLLVLVLAGCSAAVEEPTVVAPASAPDVRADGAQTTPLPGALLARWEGSVETSPGTSLPLEGFYTSTRSVADLHDVRLPGDVTRITLWLNWSEPGALLDVALRTHIDKEACSVAPSTSGALVCTFVRGPLDEALDWKAGVVSIYKEGAPASVDYTLDALFEAAAPVRLGPPGDGAAALRFAPSVGMPAAEDARLPEPSIAVAPGGTVWVAAPDGLQVHVWRSDDGVLFEEVTLPAHGAVGDTNPFNSGGDADIVVVDDQTIYVVGQAGATTQQVFATHDGGASWTVFSLASLSAVSDRAYLVADGPSRAWLSYRGESGPQITRTVDGGRTWLLKTPVPDLGCPLYTFARGGDGSLWLAGCDAKGPAVAVSFDDGLTWTVRHVADSISDDPQFSFCRACHTLISVAADREGSAYVAWADTTPTPDAAEGSLHVWLAASQDRGASWTPPARVDPPGGNAAMPWVTVGPPGHVAVGFYATRFDGAYHTVLGDWYPMVAASDDALADPPAWRVAAMSDEPNIVGPICFSGTACAAGRGLGDFFQVALDAQGAVHAAYARSFDEQYGPVSSHYARQVDGPTLGGPSAERTGGLLGGLR